MQRTAAATVDANPGTDKNNGLVTLLSRLLRPLVLLMLKRGMTAYEFGEIARWVFAQVALDRQHFAVRGRDAWSTTKSRAAVLTGLTRREVNRLARMAEPSSEAARRNYHRSFRVLSAWMETAGYQDENGQPRDLPIKGAEGSLECLVREHCRDITIRAMLDELVERGCVTRIDRHTVRYIGADFADLSVPDEEVEHLSRHAEQFMAAIEKRLDPDELVPPEFSAHTLANLAPEHLHGLNEHLRLSAREFIARLQQDSTDFEQATLAKTGDSAFIGVYHLVVRRPRTR